jgi:hypothetical protein
MADMERTRAQLEIIDEFIEYLNGRDKIDSLTWWRLTEEEEKQGIPFGRLCHQVDGRLTAYRRMRTKLRQMKARFNKKLENERANA